MKAIHGLFAGILAISVSVPTFAAGDAAAGKTKAAACAACHGTDGNSTNSQYPKLAGQNAAYLYKQLDEFKDGTRNDPVMMGMVAALSTQDMQDLAAFYAGQAATASVANADLVELGKSIYRGGIKESGVGACMGCHGPAGNGNGPAGFPSLAGQHAEYTVKVLQDFQRGDRVNDPNKMMRLATYKMKLREMTAVAEYVAGLQP